MGDKSYIYLKGITENNLKNIDVKIHKNKITAITGVSGSGKSSLAFDTIYSLGKSLYLEALSTDGYKQQRPKVISAEGLVPPIAVSQASLTNSNPRSTVGTLMHINQYFRMLFSLLGQVECPSCHKKLRQNEKCSCGYYVSPLMKPNMFSFNHVNGMCLECGGLGRAVQISKDAVIPDERITLVELRELYAKDKALSYVSSLFEAGIHYLNVSPDTRFCDLTKEQKKFVLYGSNEKIDVIIPATKNGQPSRKTELYFQGFISGLKKIHQTSASVKRKKYIEDKFMKIEKCAACDGKRLNKLSLSVTIENVNFSDLLRMSLSDVIAFLTNLKDNKLIMRTANNELEDTINILIKKIKNVINVRLEYITLDRQLSTLSGGEVQRLKLSNYLSVDLTNVLYIFDEPSSGLHYKDIKLINNALKTLCDLGNTIIVVEHNSLVIKACDYIIDVGPGAGKHGGELVATGSINEVLNNDSSLTARYLNRKYSIGDLHPKNNFQEFLYIENANENNLKNISVKIPLNAFVCITGVSGSGKSTLISEVLYKKLEQDISKNIFNYSIEKVCYISQKPIGKQKRSMIATYVGVFDKIRNLYSRLKDAQIAGLENSDFGLNGGNGRCEKCKGMGYVEQDMYFLPSINLLCDDCNGSRYKESILRIKYKGYNISEILDMTVEECLTVFSAEHEIYNILEVINDIGLGYLNLGQNTVSLSGGECQRLKLVNELSKKCNNTLYIFDEPSTGLHAYDVEKLMIIFDKLLLNKASLIIIEHNMDIIQKADYIIDLGPDGGENGGEIVAKGSPLEIMENTSSFTGQVLYEIFSRSNS